MTSRIRATERLQLASQLIKSGSALLGEMGQIARGPGRYISQMLRERPLIAAGMDNLNVAGMGKQLGDLPGAFQRGLFNPSAKMHPMTGQVRTQMAQYLRSAKPQFEHFSGAPEFYPQSQFREVPLPAGGRMPVRLDGYMGPDKQWLTSWYNGQGRGSNFTAGSTGIAPTGGSWHGVQMPEFPSHDVLQNSRYKPAPIAFAPRQS